MMLPLSLYVKMINNNAIIIRVERNTNLTSFVLSQTTTRIMVSTLFNYA